MKASDMLIFDRRKARAMGLAYWVMNIIDEHIRPSGEEGNHPRMAVDKLMEAFYDAGVEAVTDQLRKEVGLPPRGPLGWTREELAIMEAKRVQAMLEPITFPIISETARSTERKP